MVRVGDRVRLSSGKAAEREGIVIAVTGTVLRVRWPSDEETTVVPAPGTLSVLASEADERPPVTRGRAGPKQAPAKKQAAAKKTTAKKSAAGKKTTAKTTAASAKKAAPKTTAASAKKAASKTTAGTAKKAPAKKRSTGNRPSR